MSNELNNIICLNADGVYEGVAIGGDRLHIIFIIDDNQDMNFEEIIQHRLRFAHSCILARVLLHTGVCANAALLTHLGLVLLLSISC